MNWGSSFIVMFYLHINVLREWRDPDSNRGHHDFQSCALPTELSRQGAVLWLAYRAFVFQSRSGWGSGTFTRLIPTLGEGDYTHPRASSKHVAQGV
jgi:hypothetical protein